MTCNVNTTIRIELWLTRPLLESISDLPVIVKVSVTSLQHLVLKSQGLIVIEKQVKLGIVCSTLPSKQLYVFNNKVSHLFQLVWQDL